MNDLVATVPPTLGPLFLDFFVNEGLAARRLGPAYHLWLITPWASQIQFAVANRGPYLGLFGSTRAPLLSEILNAILGFGGNVHLGLQQPWRGQVDAAGGTAVTSQLVRILRGLGQPRLEVGWIPNLHAKLYVGMTGAITASANLTHWGLMSQREFATYTHDIARVDRLRTACESFWALRSPSVG